MKHIQTVSKRPAFAQQGSLSPLESIILLLMGIFFQDFQNYPQVSQNLEKFFRKTPS